MLTRSLPEGEARSSLHASRWLLPALEPEHLRAVLDDYSRHILAWTLRPTMQTRDAIETLKLARAKTGVDRVATPISAYPCSLWTRS
jgi:transposase InsO family protein